MIRAAGVLLQSPEGRVLLLQRAPDAKDHPGEWCFPGGGVDGAETTEQAAVRECQEETGYEIDGAGAMLCSRVSEEDGVHFTTYHKKVDAEFTPKLNEEHVGYAWVSPKDALGGTLQ